MTADRDALREQIAVENVAAEGDDCLPADDDGYALADRLFPLIDAYAAQVREDALAPVLALHKPERRWQPSLDAEVSYDTAEETAEAWDMSAEDVTYFEVCAHCKTVEDGPCDGECTRDNGYRESLWPCPTARAAGVSEPSGSGPASAKPSRTEPSAEDQAASGGL